VQPKLNVGQPGDKYEQEADQVATDVVNRMNTPASPTREGETIQHQSVAVSTAPIATIQRVYQVNDKQKITYKKLYKMRNSWYQAAIDLISELLDDTWGATRYNLKKLSEQYTNEIKEEGADNVVTPEQFEAHFEFELPKLLTKQISETIKQLKNQIKNQFLRNNKQKRGIAIGTLLKENFIRLTNQDPDSWKIIKKFITDKTNNDTQIVSTQTPVNEAYHETYSQQGGVEGKKYGYTGLSSMSERIRPEQRSEEESERPANLWYSEFHEIDSQNNNYQELFSAFRSGAFSAYNVKDDATRKKANIEKARGVLEAMVLKKLYDLWHIDGRKVVRNRLLSNYLDGRDTLNILVVAIDLLSDVAFGKGDAKMVQDHQDALAYFKKGTHDFTIKWPYQNGSILLPKTVKAKFDIIDFTTSVNQFSTGVFGQAGKNEEALQKLSEAVASTKYMNRLTISDLTKKATAISTTNRQQAESYRNKASEVAIKDRQIENLFNEIKENIGKTGSYRLPSLISNLAYMIGYMVHFNCKSGKDRTGLMDVESKFMARELSERRKKNNSSIPAEEFENEEQKERHHQLLWEAGNLEILEGNTRGQSLKVGDVALKSGLKKLPTSDKALMERLGGEEVLRDLRGLAKYTNIDKIV
jgi:hypothetical protein